MISRMMIVALAATLVVGTSTFPTTTFAEMLKKEETKKEETKKETKKSKKAETGEKKAMTPQQQKMKDCAGKWGEEKTAKKVSGQKAYRAFMSGCLKG
jgi:hypothetical protein